MRRINLCFHPNEGIELTIEQRCLLDNVWSFCNIKQKVITCHSLAQYFTKLNSRKLNLEKSFSIAYHLFHALDNSSPSHPLLRKDKVDISTSYKNISSSHWSENNNIATLSAHASASNKKRSLVEVHDQHSNCTTLIADSSCIGFIALSNVISKLQLENKHLQEVMYKYLKASNIETMKFREFFQLSGSLYPLFLRELQERILEKREINFYNKYIACQNMLR